MLPDRLFSAIELGELKDERFKNEPTDEGIYTKKRKDRPLIRPMAALLSLSVALASIGFAVSLFAEQRKTLANAAVMAMLYANFPFPVFAAASDASVPAGVISDVPPSEGAELPPSQSADDGREQGEEPPEGGSGAGIYDYDLSVVPEGAFPIIPVDLSLPSLGKYYISNETPYNPDIGALSYSSRAIEAWSGAGTQSAPLVLIIHTHATEAYSEEGALWYEGEGVAPRTEDTSKNVVAVGAVMASVFREMGVPTLHCTILHDKESYMNSYNRAAETIRSYLEKYPSIKYIFDVHRDSLIRENGEKLRPIAEVNGRVAAQIMCVVGTDHLGAVHPNWETNLSLAALLGERLDESYPGLARHIYLRGASFNQQYTEGSLLLEIGSCGNSLEEAKYAAELTAAELAKIIKGS